MSAFPDPAAFAALYPETPGLVRHALAGHPLFGLEELVGLATRMRPADVEYNRGDLPLGIANDAVPGNGLSVADTIRGIEENGSWLVLKFVEQDPAYAALLAETLAPLAAPVAARTGPMLRQEGFIFVSSPGSVTPLHFDPEHNILLQLRGTKAMTVFPADDDRIAASEAHEQFHQGTHHRNLPWQDAHAAKGRVFTLAPGDGVHVPLMAPHFVRVGGEVSVSFSVTWRSRYSFREAEARGMNARLRRLGLNPRPPGRWPARNTAKSLAFRALRRLGI